MREHVTLAVSHTATIVIDYLIFIVMLLSLTSESTATNYSCMTFLHIFLSLSFFSNCHNENGANTAKCVEML